MKLKKGVRILIAIISIMIALKMMQADVNLTISAKVFYNIVILLSLNGLASIKY